MSAYHSKEFERWAIPDSCKSKHYINGKAESVIDWLSSGGNVSIVATEQQAQDKHDQAQGKNGPSQLLAAAALGAALFAGELASQYLFSKSSPESEVQVTESIDSTDSLAALEMPLRR